VTSDGDDTRQRLLDRGREHYLEVGAAGFSLREVARRAGVSAAAVYRHFDDKNALLAALCSEGFRTFHGYLMGALKEKTPRARLRAAGRAYLAFGLENAQHYRVIFMSPADVLGEAARETLAPETKSSFQFLVDRVRECQEDDVLRPGDPVALAATIWGLVHGLVSLRLSAHLALLDEKTFERFFTTATDDLLHGLAP